MGLTEKDIMFVIEQELQDIMWRSDNPRRPFSVHWNETGPYVSLHPGGELNAGEVWALADIVAGMDLTLAFEVVSKREYSRIQFKHSPRNDEKKDTPDVSRRSLTYYDRGTSAFSDLNERYQKYVYEKYIKPLHPGKRGRPPKKGKESE